MQLQEQEKQVAELRARIAALEGREDSFAVNRANEKKGGTSVDDWSIKVSAPFSMLIRMLNDRHRIQHLSSKSL